MKYVVIETFKAGKAEAVYERFHAAGRMLPDGLSYLDSWREHKGHRCFQLMETDDERLFDVWIARWADLVDYEVIPIREP